jgi:predicted CXXCH cytochrome family protein
MKVRGLAALVLLLTSSCDSGPGQPRYVGTGACVTCHEDQTRDWLGSHHDLAMQEATPETVLGDFGDATFDYAGITTTFFQRDGAFWVRTDGPTGALEEFPVRYTFGVTPLQQYLLELPGGRFQALTIAWDSRAEDDGGQRWYHLFPDEDILAGDELHWTARSHNWNRACAVCHSTDLRKGFDPASGSYATTWSDIDVGCEACHGPGSSHMAWADREDEYVPDSTGLVALRNPVAWAFDDTSRIARPTSAPDRTQIETCAPCHSRRTQLVEGHVAGRPLLDGYLPALLQDRLYYDDGQIDDEVYVYGSFVQSRMYQRGVTCSDCHDPHSLRLKAEGNTLCLQCHIPTAYDTTDHHGHGNDSEGAACVACHMPDRRYMGVDDRRDHSMRVPRPDLTVSIGTPNACNDCHSDRSAAWAQRSLEDRGVDTPPPHFATVLHGARRRGPDAERALVSLAHQDTLPAIVQATAISELQEYPSRPTLQVLLRTLDSPDPSVRVAALRTLEMASPEQRFQLAEHRLRDSSLSVRSEAGRVLAGTPRELMTAAQAASLDSAVAAYLTIQALDADHPVSHVNRGLVLSARSRHEEAEAAYRNAIALEPSWIPAYANLADLYRRLQREADAEQLLRDGIATVESPAPLHHSLGLSLVRQGRKDEAVEQLRLAALLAPDAPRFAYVYAVALQDVDRPEDAAAVLEVALRSHPNDPDLVFTMATMALSEGNWSVAERWGRHLKVLEPFRERADVLLADIQARRSAGGRR